MEPSILNQINTQVLTPEVTLGFSLFFTTNSPISPVNFVSKIDLMSYASHVAPLVLSQSFLQQPPRGTSIYSCPLGAHSAGYPERYLQTSNQLIAVPYLHPSQWLPITSLVVQGH